MRSHQVAARCESCPAVQTSYSRSVEHRSPLHDVETARFSPFLRRQSDAFVSTFNADVDSTCCSSGEELEPDCVWRPW